MDTCRVYKAAERVFDQRLPVEQRLLAFDKYWEGCDLEGEGKKKKEEEGAHSFMRYEVAPDEFQDVLQGKINPRDPLFFFLFHFSKTRLFVYRCGKASVFCLQRNRIRTCGSPHNFNHLC